MQLLQGIPDILYKYRNWEDKYNRKILKCKELYLSSADQLNDPFDAALPFQYDPQELTEENIIKKLLLVGRNVYPEKTDDELIRRARERYNAGEFTDEYWKKFSPSFKKQVNDRYGIYCLTTKNDNLLMWAHYANSHRGFCIGYDKFELFKIVEGLIGRVTYSTDFPKVPLFEEGILGLTKLVTTKSTHWEYENEYRMTKTFASRKTLKLTETSIKEIIFGCNINQKHKSKIIYFAKKNFVGIKFYDCQIDDEVFKINIVPVNH